MAAKYYFIALFGMFACVANAEAAGAGAAGPGAAGIEKPMFTFGGFGSLGVSYSSMGLGDYVPDSSYPSGPGISGAWSATNDTRIAGQYGSPIHAKISAVLQVDSEFHSRNYLPAGDRVCQCEV